MRMGENAGLRRIRAGALGCGLSGGADSVRAEADMFLIGDR